MVFERSVTNNISDAKKIGQMLKKSVNEKYKLLEIEIDGIFKKLLLLKKKKYAALVVSENPDGTISTVTETKGLDMVRRDWCGLSVETSSYGCFSDGADSFFPVFYLMIQGRKLSMLSTSTCCPYRRV